MISEHNSLGNGEATKPCSCFVDAIFSAFDPQTTLSTPQDYCTASNSSSFRSPSVDMISFSIARVARSASCSPSNVRAGSFAATSQAYHCAIRPVKQHQRRLSSSKASIPPNGSPRSRSSAPSQQQPSAPASGRTRGKKAKALIWESQFGHLPSVPSTQHLHPAGECFVMHLIFALLTSMQTSMCHLSFHFIVPSR